MIYTTHNNCISATQNHIVLKREIWGHNYVHVIYLLATLIIFSEPN